jgi:GNAT superfamily N-acetyltransferase
MTTSPTAQTRQLSHATSNDAVQLRHLTPADAHHMTDLHERLSPHSRYLRFFRLVRSLAPADIARFVAVSPSHAAVGAFDGDVLVGAAHYFRSEHQNHAEVAIEVADSHHRRRIGARLLHELAGLAAVRGITHLTATVLAENRPVLGLIRNSGWDIATTPDGAYADIVVTLPPELVGARAGCEQRPPSTASARHGQQRRRDLETRSYRQSGEGSATMNRSSSQLGATWRTSSGLPSASR